MKNIITLFGILFFTQVVSAQKISDDFTGRWKAPKGAIIIVTKTTDGYIGKTELEKAVVLKDVKFANDKWTAIVLNPKENLVANCELVLQQSKLKIIVRKGILYRTIIWVKQ
ncbi:MAG: hypothetical protein Q8L81_01465 [Bacteroidota bacterium]|nr:hypothetical protein [Bacteroidota bacterium]